MSALDGEAVSCHGCKGWLLPRRCGVWQLSRPFHLTPTHAHLSSARSSPPLVLRRAVFYAGKANVKYTGEVRALGALRWMNTLGYPWQSKSGASDCCKRSPPITLQLVYILMSGANFSYPISGSYEQARGRRDGLLLPWAQSAGMRA